MNADYNLGEMDGVWRFDKIPQSVVPDIKISFRNGNYKHLKRVIDQYDVLPPTACRSCNMYTEIDIWFGWAIEYYF